MSDLKLLRLASEYLQVIRRNIDALPMTMVAILEQVREKTGFMGVCTFYGSEPKAGGNVVSYS